MKSTSVVYASRRGRVTSVYLPWARLVSGSPAAFIPSIRSGRVAVMAYSNSPPGRRSSLWTAVVNPSGPHQGLEALLRRPELPDFLRGRLEGPLQPDLRSESPGGCRGLRLGRHVPHFL